jgi:hypothetical protein
MVVNAYPCGHIGHIPYDQIGFSCRTKKMRMRQTKKKAKARQRIDASCTLLLCGDMSLAKCRARGERGP